MDAFVHISLVVMVWAGVLLSSFLVFESRTLEEACPEGTLLETKIRFTLSMGMTCFLSRFLRKEWDVFTIILIARHHHPSVPCWLPSVVIPLL